MTDRRALAHDLRAAVEGDVRFDTAARALYATDASNFRQPPVGVVVPRTLDDVVAVHRICHEHGAPIVNRGCGTSLSGEAVNVAVVIDHSKHLRAIGDVDLDTKTVVVEAGAVNEKVNEHTAREGLVFGPDPSTHAYCTIGGNVGNNSCGTHSVQAQFYGPGPRTSDNVHSLEVVTYDGERFWVGGDEAPNARRDHIYGALRVLAERHAQQIRARFPSVDELPRRVSGYNLDDLLPERGFDVARALVGTESTCVTVLRARLRLTPALPARALVAVACTDICSAADQVPWILEHRPVGLEGFDRLLFEHERDRRLNPRALAQLPDVDDGGAWLFVELGAETSDDAKSLAHAFLQDARAQGTAAGDLALFDDEDDERALWQVREAGLAAAAFPPGGGDFWPGWEDSAVPPPRLGAYLRDLKRLYREHGLHGAFYGHVGQGCMHSRIDFDLRTRDGLRTYRTFLEAAADLVVSYGGSLSGEHGDGQQRAELLPKQYGEDLVEAFREFKRIWDPDWGMNPGKVVDPHRFDDDLRLGADYAPWRPATKFRYAEDGGDFAHAALRCVGVGKCRTPDGVDVMCPSFIATREEMHTTRGRARLLFEMLEGEVVTDGWQSREVQDALDLCLSCKGCTHDCPVDVDLPTYKAEFLYHHYRRRLRPRHAYAFGLIDQAARAASHAPRVANALARTRTLKRVAGLAPEREPPAFARQTFQRWFAARGGTRVEHGPRVVVFPDTFTNHFHPEVGIAAVEALEAAGWQVVVPDGHLCCGRPLYDYGFLGLAERYLRRLLARLRPWYSIGVPIVGLEPSCVAVLKDELPKLLGDEGDALRAHTYHFAELYRAFELEPPRREASALVWGHCHQKATGGLEADLALLRAMGVEAREVKAGCCGLAGSWGFEADHYALSLEIAAHGLLHAVRAASAGELVVANGFSCRTQIEHGTGRRALHIAEVLRQAG